MPISVVYAALSAACGLTSSRFDEAVTKSRKTDYLWSLRDLETSLSLPISGEVENLRFRSLSFYLESNAPNRTNVSSHGVFVKRDASSIESMAKQLTSGAKVRSLAEKIANNLIPDRSPRTGKRL